MPSFDIVRTSTPRSSFRVDSVCGTYDLQQKTITEHFKGEINLPDKWNVGLIVGRSGSGKTTIAKELFGDKIIHQYEYTHESFLDDMPKNVSVNDICMALTAVGFASPPSWLKPYNVLSNGEKMRCDIARAMLENDDIFVFDEFTSVVDRNVAQIASFAIQKAIRKKNKQFIAVTCHYDVQDWLMPDWVFNTDDMIFQQFDVEKQKKNRPRLNISIYETLRKDYYWKFFSKYHYLNHSFNKASRVFIATCNDNVCGLCAVLPFPHPIKKNAYKGHRTVIIPDYQGVGIGGVFTDYVAQLFIDEGKHYISTTSNPSMIHARMKNPKWVTTRKGRASKGSSNGKIQNKNKKGSTSSARITMSFEYVGETKAQRIKTIS